MLYGSECWVGQKNRTEYEGCENENAWMSGVTREDRIRNN